MMRGVAELTRRTYEDGRGRLHAFEAFDNLPFLPRRVFFIEVETAATERGGHANSCAEVIIAVRGGVTVEVNNGYECGSIRLAGGDGPLWVSPGVVIRLTRFEANSLLLVCASECYGQTAHFPEPQADLVVDGPSPQ
jgi:hypothetical protein